MPITINIGLDPAVTIRATFEPPTTPLGYDELDVAGALRQEPVQLVDGVSVDESALARSEYVLEGYIMPKETIKEDINTDSGFAMPEFPGYNGPANPAVNVVKLLQLRTEKNNQLCNLLLDQVKSMFQWLVFQQKLQF